MAEVASLHESFYRPLGDGRYASGPSTAGPWSPKAQHGGPPSALMGRAFEQHEAREGFRIARITLELPRPVPVGDLRAEVRTLRSGGRTELLEGELTSDGRSVLMARAWRVVEQSCRHSPAAARFRPAAASAPAARAHDGGCSPGRLHVSNGVAVRARRRV